MRWRASRSRSSRRIVPKRIAREDPRHAKTEYPIYPEPMFGAYKERREEHGVQLYGSLGIDADRRVGAVERNSRRTSSSSTRRSRCSSPSTGGSAPANGPISAATSTALALLARGYGLDTCPQEAWARLYDTVGEFLKLPPNEMLFCGMAIGYGDRKHKANDFRSPRAELQEFCKFYGFD